MVHGKDLWLFEDFGTIKKTLLYGGRNTKIFKKYKFLLSFCNFYTIKIKKWL